MIVDRDMCGAGQPPPDLAGSTLMVGAETHCLAPAQGVAGLFDKDVHFFPAVQTPQAQATRLPALCSDVPAAKPGFWERAAGFFRGLLGMVETDCANTLRTFGTPRATALGKQTARGTVLDVTIWNTEKAKDKDFPEAFRRFASQSDLFLTQEAVDSDKMLGGVSGKGLGWTMASTFVDDGQATGVATGAIAPSLQNVFLRSHVGETGLLTDKMTLVSEYSLKGTSETLLVANVHGLNFVGDEAFRTQMKRIAAVLTSHDGPILLAGDFNTWNVDRRVILEDMTAGLGLKAPKWEEGRKSFLGNPLDHAYVRGMEILGSDVRTDVDESDHSPLTLRLRVPSNEASEGMMAKIKRTIHRATRALV